MTAAISPLNLITLEPCVVPKLVPVTVTKVPSGPDVGEMVVMVGVVVAVTVSPVEPATDPKVAWMVAVPAATPVANPPVVMLATPVLEEVHTTEPVRFCVLLSL